MGDIWRTIGELAATLHHDRITSVANAISRLRSVDEFERVKYLFGPNADQERITRLVASWRAAPQISPLEIAAAFRGAAQVAALMDENGAVELVWTGPTTGLIPTRHTEQVILEVIDSAQSDVFLVSYVFYKASSVVRALNACVARGVDVSILLESSPEHGGSVQDDGIGAMRDAVPGATIYSWDPAAKTGNGNALTAVVHAKCVVSDRKLAFITSANLTSAAMERNMELGVLIRGGTIPDRLRSHLNALVATGVIKECGR